MNVPVPSAEFEKFSLAVVALNSLIRKKFVCHGAKIASMCLIGIAIFVLIILDYFTVAYGTTTLAGVGYLAATSYIERIDRRIAANIRMLEHLQGLFPNEGVLAKER